MEKILNQILTQMNEGFNKVDKRLSSLEGKVSSLNEKVSSLDGRVSSLEEKVSSLDGKVSSLEQQQKQMQTDIREVKDYTKAIFDQTANLTEYHTETTEKLDIIIDDIDFIKHEEFERRQDIYKIKKDIRLAK